CLMALARQVIEVGAVARLLDLEVGERVPQHLALAAPLLEPLLAALQLAAHLVDPVFGARDLARRAVAGGEGPRELLLALRELGQERLAASERVLAAGAGGLDALLELDKVGLQAPAVVLGREEPLAERSPARAHLRETGLRGFGDGSGLGQRGS